MAAPASPTQRNVSLLLGLALLLMLLIGAAAGFYLTKVNQDLRQQAQVYGPGPVGSPGAGEVDVWCSGCGGFWMSQTEFNQGWGCNTASFERCGDYPDLGGQGDYCDSNGCDGGGDCTVIKYQCDRNTNLGGGCQDRQVAASTGELNFSANCGAEQIDVACGGESVDFISRIYPTACGVGGRTPAPRTPSPTPTLSRTPTPTPSGAPTPSGTPTPSGSPTPSGIPTPTPTPEGPMCRSIEMYDPNEGTPIILSGDDDAGLEPGETVGFLCSANTTLPAGFHYQFRIWEPCGSDNHSTPLQFVSNDGSISYNIPSTGGFAVQCAVCEDGGTDADCDWEGYTPTTCN